VSQTPTETWPAEYAAQLAVMTADELEAEILDQRKCLQVLERFKPDEQVGHSGIVGRLRLAERALTKAKQDAR